MLKLIETDSGALYDSIIEAVELETKEPLYPGDERRIFAEAITQLFVGITNLCNSACNNKMLQYAEGDALDALGYRMGVTRFPATAATATFLFTLTEAQATGTTIPAGTLITTDGDLYFATDEDLTITAGNTTGTVTATCTEPGKIGNGYAAGAVAQLVEYLDNVSTAENTTATAGGTEEEEDDDYRERIHLANSAFSTAGPTKAYEYHAKSADASIIDVVVDSPSACVVNLYILCENGLPGANVLAAVQDACNADDVRPLTDLVTALAPTSVPYDITVKYYTTAEDETECVETIEGDGGAIDQYIAWQAGAIGRNINPDKLLSLCMAPPSGTGCLRMEITAPTLTEVGKLQVAQVGTVTVTHEVVAE
jgi:phage-related baseplate assembly protein